MKSDPNSKAIRALLFFLALVGCLLVFLTTLTRIGNSIIYKERDPAMTNSQETPLQRYSRAIALEPENSEHYLNRGLEYGGLDLYESAMLDLTECIALDPDNTEAFEARGFINVKFGRDIEAIDDYSRVIELKPNDPWAYANRAAAYKRIGDFEKGEPDRALFRRHLLSRIVYWAAYC